MKLTYLLETQISQAPEGPTSALASARYRALLPGRELQAMGAEIRYLDGRTVARADLASPDQPGVTIVGKSFDPRTLEAAKRAKEAGERIVVDLCDDHFSRPEIGAHFQSLVALADLVIAPTEAMANTISQATSKEASVVPDPVEGPSAPARFSPPPDRMNICWFGHPTNLNTLAPLFGSLAKRLSERRTRLAGRAIRFEIVTALDDSVVNALRSSARGLGAGVKLALTPWSLKTTWEALARADAVVLPSLEGADKAVKSPNRLLEAINAGRVAVAHPLPSYRQFDDCAFIDADIWAAMDQALSDPAAALRRIEAGQRRIAAEFRPDTVARKWLRAIEHIAPINGLKAHSVAPQGPSADPIRLNLGCGDKILPGYINVDVAQSRRGQKPDVLCDIRELTAFDANFADEILAVHVVEHLWRWEVVDILKEWRRVLKTGGRIVLECPNLVSACQAILNDPDGAARPDVAGQRSMWVLYGDPAWKDPLMCHRWAYTPNSLAQVMAQAGFSNIRQEPAQFKMREPRDMRLVGEKN